MTHYTKFIVDKKTGQAGKELNGQNVRGEAGDVDRDYSEEVR